jgi:hypothetical protein
MTQASHECESIRVSQTKDVDPGSISMDKSEAPPPNISLETLKIFLSRIAQSPHLQLHFKPLTIREYG